MKLISEHNFSVVTGEEVAIQVMPVAIQTNLVAAMLDGQSLQPSGDGFPATYSFTATQSAYDVRVEGGYGGSEQFSIRAAGQTRVVQLEFHVEETLDNPREYDPPIFIQTDGIQPPEPWD
jgi:hypothetical protein